MNNPFEYTPDEACEEAFKDLVVRVEAMKKSKNPDDVNFCRELEEGKMLGVLIAGDSCGGRHTLYAFSGQLGGILFMSSDLFAWFDSLIACWFTFAGVDTFLLLSNSHIMVRINDTA